MNNFIGLGFYTLITVTIITLYRKSEESEPYLLLKLIGYAILGGFTFDLGDWKLPLGFLVFLLFFRNIKINAKVKKRAAYLGLVIYLLSLIIPFIQTTIFEWPREIELQNTNFYSGSLVEEWENVHNELSDFEQGVRITHFKMMMNEKGKMTDLQMDMKENAFSEEIHYRIRLSEDDEKLIVKRRKVERVRDPYVEPPYTEAGFFLAQIDLIKKSMLDHQGVDSYTLRSDGQRSGFGITDGVNYRIDTAGKHTLEKSELPVEAIVVDVCSPKCSVYEHFLFDIINREDEVTESTFLDIARKDSPEVEQWFKNHTGDKIGYEEDGGYVLIKDGEKEKVTDEEFDRALKETPIIDYQQDGVMWKVTVENPYGDAPHVMRFTLDGKAREVLEIHFDE
ncbi:hypothetical protein [Pseudalkalibacillus hwajinpoensis]|uniref:Uncharacterized protein n=1 Tax=Guptibacillus hwajinpoensis TaxID=208199 RepID=A0A4U1MNZ7_9BACL|nr:hypothetical protein [Pseudalkalibacillus hwajinpoensis]TKD72230.1 hypothetical protein FBF83_05405 [Pseudalkalibacillus hwajinpoensis]